MNRFLLTAICLSPLCLCGGSGRRAPDVFAAPVPAGRPAPAAPATSPEDARLLSLRLEEQWLTKRYPSPREDNALDITLLNAGRKPLSIAEMPTVGNLIERCTALTFVLKFGDGTVCVRRVEYPLPGSGAAAKPKRRVRPLAIAADGESKGSLPIDYVLGAAGAKQALRRDPRFRVMVCVPALKLQSDPVYFNGYEESEGSQPDAFADLAAHRKKRAK
jgi:hypothetical protein